MLLWYPFAVMTHEGWSRGDEAARSHDYYGAPLYWFSLGLSMHRAHHVYPKLSWVELKRFVRPAPRVGEHTLEVLAELGFAAAEQRALADAGVMG